MRQLTRELEEVFGRHKRPVEVNVYPVEVLTYDGRGVLLVFWVKMLFWLMWGKVA